MPAGSVLSQGRAGTEVSDWCDFLFLTTNVGVSFRVESSVDLRSKSSVFFLKFSFFEFRVPVDFPFFYLQ